MKRLLLIVAASVAIALSANAMSYQQACEEARYLTDKMAYELGLSPREYDRVYRTNLEYLLRVNDYDDFYTYHWRERNSALHVALSGRQWRLFIGTDYFYRPLSWRNGGIMLNIRPSALHYRAPRYCPPPPRLYYRPRDEWDRPRRDFGYKHHKHHKHHRDYDDYDDN